MTNSIYRWSLNLITLALLFLIVFVMTGHNLASLISFNFLSGISAAQLQSLKTIFVSIFLEALPFILLGVIISSVLHLYISEERLQRFIPRNPVLGVVYACLLGILLPVCECGMIPIVRRLISKGMPVYIGITYILAAPIINPVTFAATFMAFRTDHQMGYFRIGLAFVVALIIGIVLYYTVRKNPLKHHLEHNRHDHSNHQHDHNHSHNHKPGNRLLAVFTHASDEFFEMGKYLMIGAFLTAVIQTFISREQLVSLSGGALGSHLLMMGFAYLISLCSTSDAFVAASFSGIFPKGALLAFLVFGPMVDFKNTLMMLSTFRSRFVFRLILLVTVVVFVGSVAVGELWPNL
ncbi:permease [Paenibacillus sp. sptzw28]|uniref:permease n=1 Tax=Paenibacillus sp. sptzw28 TaxID=715179 RepID=UPI001C6E4822|nr:permease [Paenibacillus sp. sptzw28]QYR23632.1 permease [Paenibacillus sp. sptzw28]